MNKTILFIVVLAVVFSGVVWFLGNRRDEEIQNFQLPKASPTPTPPLSEINETPGVSLTPTLSPTPTMPKTVTVSMTDSGFSPSEVAINAGDTVKFVNQGSQARRPASGVHPTHELYPERGGCVSSAFDACRGLNPGESFSFTFSIKGAWPYHDNLSTSVRGTIIVK